MRFAAYTRSDSVVREAWFPQPTFRMTKPRMSNTSDQASHGPALNSLVCYIAFIRRKPGSPRVSWRRSPMNLRRILNLRTAWTVATITVAATTLLAQTNNGNGNAYGKNKNYPYGTNQTSSRPYSIGLWGDLPYSQSQADAIPAMIEDMNSQDLVFTVQDGDLRQGSGVPSCAENSSNGAGGIVDLGNIYQRGLSYFNALRAPAIFTPGDNDWTDCDRASLGSEARNSLKLLDYERSLFFSTPKTLGQTQFLQEVQSTPTCKGFLTGTDGPLADRTKSETFTYTDVACSENRRWIVGNVMYATLDVQGSCDNLCDDYPDPVEHA